MESIILKAENLTKRYGSHVALDKLNLELPKGQIIGLLGPNGSGKTTLIKLIAGLLTADEGYITVDDQLIGPKTKAVVSYLPDRPCFPKGQKICQLLDFFQDFYADFDRERAMKMLSVLSIDSSSTFRSLSKGNQEKVQLVLAMARRAKLYLLDEPIGGVDPAARDFILQTIVSNFDPDATVIISTHLIADVEPILDGYVFLHMGHVIRYGSAADSRAETGKTLDELFREVFKCIVSY